jgi:uncharacterized protein (DUF58 family)
MADVSRSMYFSTAEWSKRLRLLQVAATLGFSAESDHCNFGFLAFSDQVEAYEPPRKSRGHVWRCIDKLYHLQPQKKETNWEVALRFLRSRLRRMSIIFLLSDFVTNPAAAQLGDIPDLKALAQKHDVVPIVFTDQMETKLPTGRGLMRFRAAESGNEMLLSLSPGQRRRFETIVGDQKKNLEDLFFSLGMECLFLNVGEAFLDPLMNLFERRRKI